MSKYTTGEIAKLCGVTVRTVQYYDNRGILIPTELSEGGRRLYSEKDLSKMKVICYLRELDIPLSNIAELMKEENSKEVVDLILKEQVKVLKNEISEKNEKLQKLEWLRLELESMDNSSVESMADIVGYMKGKSELKKIHRIMLLTGIPVTVFQWLSIIIWITKGIWWLFAVYTIVAIPYGILWSRYYFRKVSYICPKCHGVFRPIFKEAFFALHTPKTRKLTCPICSYKGYCAEIIETQEDNDNE